MKAFPMNLKRCGCWRSPYLLFFNHTQSCCPMSGKTLLTSDDEHSRESYGGLLSLQAINIVYRAMGSVYSIKGLSQELEWKGATNLKDFILFLNESYYFCSFYKCYKAHDIFFDVVSGLNVDVYAYFFSLVYEKTKLFCNCKLIKKNLFCLLVPETGTGNTLTH